MDMIHESEFELPARDGYPLSAKVFLPEAPKAAVLISSGTGFPKELYARFARYGAEREYATLIYDYRGIAGSAPEEMDGFDADILDWGRQDLPAALDAAAGFAPGKPLFTLGHSVGGHLLGLADNIDRVAAHGFVTVGTGYYGAHHWSYTPNALFFWWGYGPACLALKNYIPAGGAWGGTALPRAVFEEWRRWSQRPDYFAAFYDEIGEHVYDKISAPIRSWTFSDDRLCTQRAADDLLRAYSAAPREHLRLSPRELGAKRIDHHGAFSRSAKGFWEKPFNWFDAVLDPSSESAP